MASKDTPYECCGCYAEFATKADRDAHERFCTTQTPPDPPDGEPTAKAS